MVSGFALLASSANADIARSITINASAASYSSGTLYYSASGTKVFANTDKECKIRIGHDGGWGLTVNSGPGTGSWATISDTHVTSSPGSTTDIMVKGSGLNRYDESWEVEDDEITNVN